jgi:two-component system nitrate/nitrite response regulator NarL
VNAVYEAADADTAVRITVTESIDVVSMDLRLRGREGSGEAPPEGLRATRTLLRMRPQTAVLILTMVLDEGLVAEALACGARGYLLKSADPDDVVEALHLVARGGVVLGADVGPAVLRARPTSHAWPPPFDKLTERERLLAQLVAAGRSNALIARQLGLSDKTVRNQISTLLVRLAVPDRVAVALLARERGIPSAQDG